MREAGYHTAGHMDAGCRIRRGGASPRRRGAYAPAAWHMEECDGWLWGSGVTGMCRQLGQRTKLSQLVSLSRPLPRNQCRSRRTTDLRCENTCRARPRRLALPSLRSAKKKGCHARHIAGNDPYDAGCMWTMFARTVFRFSHMNSKQPEATRTVTDIEASHSNAGLREGRHLDGPPSPDIHFVRIATTFLIFWLINCMFLDSRYPQSAKKIRKHLHPL